MKDKVEKSRAEKQKKKEDEAKEKSRKGKDKHEDKEQLTEKDKKKHKQYVAEIIQKLKAHKGNNAKTFKEFHASKVKLAKDLEGRYQKKLKKGINIDITIPPLERDKKDNDVDFKVKIAPNTTQQSDAIEFKGEEEEVGLEDAKIDVKVPFSMAGEGHKLKVRTENGKLMLFMASKEEELKKKWATMEALFKNYQKYVEDVPGDLKKPIKTELKGLYAELSSKIPVFLDYMSNLEKYHKEEYLPNFKPTNKKPKPVEGTKKKNDKKELRKELSLTIEGKLKKLANELAQIARKYGIPDLSPLGVEKLRIEEHVKPLQAKIQVILDEFKNQLEKAVPKGTKVRYRGSLATGIRSYKGETLDEAAELINPDCFDADIYLEVTDDVFQQIVDADIKLDGLSKFPLKRVTKGTWLYRDDILKLENIIRTKLTREGWYKKKDNGKADFDFFIQTSGKSYKQEIQGNEYPLGALEKAGFPNLEKYLKQTIGRKRHEDDKQKHLEGEDVRLLPVKPVTVFEF